jgi:ribosome-associated protein
MTTNSKTITLSQFLKFIGIADTGGQAKMMIQSGEVLVNGTVDTRRGRQLVTGDRVTVGSQTFKVNVN